MTEVGYKELLTLSKLQDRYVEYLEEVLKSGINKDGTAAM